MKNKLNLAVSLPISLPISKKLFACLIILLGTLCNSKMVSAQKDPSIALENLFQVTRKTDAPYGKKTFVFFVEGAADHFVFNSMNDTKKTFRADVIDTKRIIKYAKSCEDCNVVVLHIQRGGAQ